MRLTVPNQLTILRIGLTPVFLLFFLKENPSSQLIASVIYVLASLTDWYDGWFARRFGVITRWGQFMDPLADKFLVSTALIVFAWMDYVKWWMVWIIVLRDVIVTGIRVYGTLKGNPIVTSMLAKWKTFTQMSIVFVILIFISWLNYYGPGSSSYHSKHFDFIGISMLTVTILTLTSAVIYFFENWRLIWRMFKELVTFASR